MIIVIEIHDTRSFRMHTYKSTPVQLYAFTVNSIKINLNFKEYERKCKLNADNSVASGWFASRFSFHFVCCGVYCVRTAHWARAIIHVYSILCRMFGNEYRIKSTLYFEIVDAITSPYIICVCVLQNQIDSKSMNCPMIIFFFIHQKKQSLNEIIVSVAVFLSLPLLMLYHDLRVQIIG